MVHRFDVGDAAAVPSAADSWTAAPRSPDVLFNTAGKMGCARSVTALARREHGRQANGRLRALKGILPPALDATVGGRRRMVNVTSRPSATACEGRSVNMRAGRAPPSRPTPKPPTSSSRTSLAAIGSPVTVVSAPADAAASSVIFGIRPPGLPSVMPASALPLRPTSTDGVKKKNVSLDIRLGRASPGPASR